MPNYCTNTLTVTGPAKSVTAFVNAVDPAGATPGGIVDTYLPFPEDLQGPEYHSTSGAVMGRDFTHEGLNWCLQHWGTKWGDCDLRVLGVTDGPDTATATLMFYTAWDPMGEGLRRVSAMVPDLHMTLEYREDDMGILGVCIFHDGEITAVTYASHDELPVEQEPDDDEDVAILNAEAYEQAIQDTMEMLRQRLADSQTS